MSEEYNPGSAAPPTEGGISEDYVTFDDTPLKKFPGITEERIYGLTLHDVQVVDNPFEPGGKRYSYLFAVDGFDPEADGCLEYFTAYSGRGDKNEELKKVFGLELAGVVQVKKSDLVGRKARGIVAFATSKRTGKPYPKIEKLMKA